MYCKIRHCFYAQAPEHLRFIAGTQIKNALGGTSFAIQDFKKQRWLALDGNLRIQIKGGLLRLLCDRSPIVFCKLNFECQVRANIVFNKTFSITKCQQF